MQTFKAHIATKSEKESILRLIREDPQTLYPLRNLRIEPDEPEYLLETGYLVVTGRAAATELGIARDTEPAVSEAVQRILEGHLKQRYQRLCVYSVSVGSATYNPPEIDDPAGGTILDQPPRRLSLIGLRELPLAAAEDLEIISLGPESPNRDRRPPFPVVIRVPTEESDEYLTLLTHDELNAWAVDNFESWTIAPV